jgi:hypothetical protein
VPLPTVAVYQVVVRKEAERRALQEAEPDSSPQEPRFGELVKTMWEEKQQGMQRSSSGRK